LPACRCGCMAFQWRDKFGISNASLGRWSSAAQRMIGHAGHRPPTELRTAASGPSNPQAEVHADGSLRACVPGAAASRPVGSQEHDAPDGAESSSTTKGQYPRSTRDATGSCLPSPAVCPSGPTRRMSLLSDHQRDVRRWRTTAERSAADDRRSRN